MSELQFFMQLCPGMDEEEVQETLELMMQFMDPPEREPDGIDSARERAFAKLNNRKIDIDD